MKNPAELLQNNFFEVDVQLSKGAESLEIREAEPSPEEYEKEMEELEQALFELNDKYRSGNIDREIWLDERAFIRQYLQFLYAFHA